VDARFDEVLYGDLELTDLVGSLQLRDGAARIEDLDFSMLGGRVSLSGAYEAPTDQRADVALKVDMVEFEVGKVAAAFESLRTIAPVVENASGRFSTDFELSTTLGPDLTPDLATLLSAGLLPDIRQKRSATAASFGYSIVQHPALPTPNAALQWAMRCESDAEAPKRGTIHQEVNNGTKDHRSRPSVHELHYSLGPMSKRRVVPWRLWSRQGIVQRGDGQRLLLELPELRFSVRLAQSARWCIRVERLLSQGSLVCRLGGRGWGTRGYRLFIGGRPGCQLGPHQRRRWL